MRGVVTWPSRRSRCPVCGAPGHACGGPTDITPVDQRMETNVRGQPLQPLEVTTPSGLKTIYRIAPNDVARYQRMSDRNEQARRQRQPAEAEGKQRRPRQRTSGAVETK